MIPVSLKGNKQPLVPATWPTGGGPATVTFQVTASGWTAPFYCAQEAGYIDGRGVGQFLRIENVSTGGDPTIYIYEMTASIDWGSGTPTAAYTPPLHQRARNGIGYGLHARGTL